MSQICSLLSFGRSDGCIASAVQTPSNDLRHVGRRNGSVVRAKAGTKAARTDVCLTGLFQPGMPMTRGALQSPCWCRAFSRRRLQSASRERSAKQRHAEAAHASQRPIRASGHRPGLSQRRSLTEKVALIVSIIGWNVAAPSPWGPL